jgi:hypothetical protein
MLLGVPLRDTPPHVRAIVSYYAVMDAPQGVPDEYRAFLNENTPLAMLRRNGARVAPILVARAGLDNPGLNAGIDAFVREALGQGAEIQLLNHGQGRHGFDILDNNDRSREIIRATLEFLKAHLR